MASPHSLRSRLEQHLPALHAYLRLQAGPRIVQRESTTDLAQSVCGEVLEDLEAIEDRGDAAFRRLLFHRASQKLADRGRYWKSHKRDVDREVPMSRIGDHEARGLLGCYGEFCTPSRNAVSQEELERIEGAFARLPEHWREAVVLIRIAGFSLAEAAAKMGQSEGQVRGFLTRGLARLAARLKLGSCE